MPAAFASFPASARHTATPALTAVTAIKAKPMVMMGALWDSVDARALMPSLRALYPGSSKPATVIATIDPADAATATAAGRRPRLPVSRAGGWRRVVVIEEPLLVGRRPAVAGDDHESGQHDDGGDGGDVETRWRSVAALAGLPASKREGGWPWP